MKNWKTSLIGLALGLIPLAQQTLNALGTGTVVDWKQVLFGIGLITLGVVSKDFNSSGTTKL